MPSFDLKQVIHELAILNNREFYGHVEIKFRAGEIIQVTKLESLAPKTNIDIKITLPSE